MKISNRSMPVPFMVHESHDWCHICGERSHPLMDVFYPDNAEHGGPRVNYVRICEKCVGRMQRIFDATEMERES